MKQTLHEQIDRIKIMMNLNEDDSQSMIMLQQDTQEFNQKVDEDLTIEEYEGIICLETDNIDLPSNVSGEDRQKIMELKEKMKTASFSELMQVKKQLKELKRQSKLQSEQVAAPAVVTLLGVSMNPGVAIAVGVILFALVLSFLGKLFRTKRTTYFCDGTRSRGLFGLLRW
jgi:hypothetical protein